MKFKYTFLLFAWVISSSLSHASDFDSLSELIQKGKETEAIAKINRYIQKYPNDPKVKFIYGATLDHFGVLYAKLGEYSAAYIFFGSALRLKPNYQEAKNNQWLVQQKIN